MVSWLTVAVLALTCVVYAAFCAAVVRAFFRTRVNRTAYRAAGAWAACFGVTDELVVSLNTVKSHVRRIYAKMGVNGKADLLEKVSSAI